jgi:sugar lactone lactonase YvrE
MTDDEQTPSETPRLDGITRTGSTEPPTRTTGSSRRRFLSGVVAATGIAFGTSSTAAHEATTEAAEIAKQAQAEVVADFEPPNLPENITTDSENVYVSMAPAHQIWQVPPQGDPSSVASIGPEDGEGILLGVTRTDDGTMYAALNSGVADTHGVWRVPADGSAERMASIPTEGTFPNGITHELLDDGVLVSDSARGAIWRATDDGAEAWFDSPLLNPNPYADSAIGINGIDVGPEGDLYAANLNFGAIVRIPVEEGTPGDSPEVIVQSDDLVGADGIAVDDQRNVYVAVNATNKVSMVTADGSVETVISGGELDFPSDVHFGPGDDQSTLYVCNFAFVAFQSGDETANPNLMRIDLGGEGGDAETTTVNGTTTTEDGE